MDLVKLITDKVQEVESSGKLSEIIEKHVTSCVDNIVSDSFRWSGEAKKAIEEALKGQLSIAVGDVKLVQYNKLVADIVSNELQNSAIAPIKSKIENIVSEFTGILDKKEWKLSELIELYKKDIDTSYDGDMDDQFGRVNLEVAEDGSFCHICFSTGKRVCSEDKILLYVYKGELTSVHIEDERLKPNNSSGLYSDFAKTIFNLYCNGVAIVLDEDDCDLYYYREDCD